MSPIGVSGPELFIGTDAAYVALARPQIDPTLPEVVLAAEEAGVTPEEFAGPGTIWALMLDVDGEGDGFELPGARDAEADDFAEQLQRYLAAAEPFVVEAGGFLSLDARPADGAAWRLTARVTPPEGHDQGPRTLELGPLPTAELLADLEDFRRSLA
ncbi:hypothetical protein ACFWAR_28495 [Streptomyces sp. NPDC059917]|uniref:hypothetical protein n=1 Tax=Streptomyces sp. NPDC059917 TaxID=3347002 RepID=UPI0036490EDD